MYVCILILILIINKLASVGFMGSMVPENKKILATYPVFLFYFFLAWFILTE